MRIRSQLAVIVALISITPVHAANLINTTWVPSSTVKTTGTGTLGASTVGVVTAGLWNGGITIDQDWTALSFINGKFDSISPNGAFVMDYGPNATTTETVTFSDGGVTNPFVLINFIDEGVTYDFGANKFTVVANSDVTVSGNTIAFASGTTNGANSGFVLAFHGLYNSLSFNTINTTGIADSIGYSVGIAVPEPSTYAFGVIATGVMAAIASRRKAGMGSLLSSGKEASNLQVLYSPANGWLFQSSQKP